MTEATSYYGTGRRKKAIARVWLFEGKGLIKVNGKSCDEYFTVLKQAKSIIGPLIVTGTIKDYDIDARVKGGGINGQAGAILLGISRALAKIDRKYHEDLKKRGYLTRDARMVERKKHGRHKARKGHQFSKR